MYQEEYLQISRKLKIFILNIENFNDTFKENPLFQDNLKDLKNLQLALDNIFDGDTDNNINLIFNTSKELDTQIENFLFVGNGELTIFKKDFEDIKNSISNLGKKILGSN